MMYIYPLEEIKPDYNFLMGYHTGIPKEWYCGIEGITSIFMGAWNDSLVGYKGYAINESYLDGMWDWYYEEHPKDDEGEHYEEWLREHKDEVFETLDYLIEEYEKEMRECTT